MAKQGSAGAIDRVKDAASGGNGNGGGLSEALKSKELLTSAALSAAGAVAVAKGPDLLRKLTGATEEKGREQAEELGREAAEGAKRSLIPAALGGGGEGGHSGKKTRRLPIQRWTDVAVPVEKAYEAWTKFDDFPRFMHRVLRVEKKGQDRIQWEEKIWFSKRQWEGRITERRKNDRIVWTTKSGMSHKGIVSFHRIDDNLTRVMVEMEFEPSGMLEKMASGLRFVKRAVQADLARFKAFVEMEDAKGITYRPPSHADHDGGQNGDRHADGQTSDPHEGDERRRERQRQREERRHAHG